MTRLPAVLAAAALLTLLAACGPGSPAPTGTADSDPSGEPTTEPTGAAVDRPEPRFGEGCDALVPDALLTAIFPFAVAPHDLLETEFSAWPEMPRHAHAAQIGGMLCEWSNGEPYSSQTGASAFRGMQLTVLPDAAEGWTRMSEYYGFSEDVGQVFCYGGNCGFDVFAEGYWFSAELSLGSSGDVATVQAFADNLRAAAAGFGSPAERWYPVGHRPLPSDCDAVVPESLVRDAFGDARPLYSDDGAGGWSAWAEAQLMSADRSCGYADNEYRGAGFYPLGGGAWLAEALGVRDLGTAVTLDGLHTEEWASLRCTSATSCTIDIVAGGNWITAYAYEVPDAEATASHVAQNLASALAD